VIAIVATVMSASTVYAINTVGTGFRVNRATTATIDAHGVCKEVTNSSGSVDYFIPTKASGEWSAVRSAVPGISNLSLAECALPPTCITDFACSTCPNGTYRAFAYTDHNGNPVYYDFCNDLPGLEGYYYSYTGKALIAPNIYSNLGARCFIDAVGYGGNKTWTMATPGDYFTENTLPAGSYQALAEDFFYPCSYNP